MSVHLLAPVRGPLAVLLAAGCLTGLVCAGHHRQRVCTWNCLPKYNYGYDDTLLVAREFCSLTPADTVAISLPQEGGGQFNLVQKTFPFPATQMTAGRVTLTEPALRFLSSGQPICTARLFHDGGDHQQLKGGNVRVRLLAYAGTAEQATPPRDAPIVWHSQVVFWVPKGPARWVSLVPCNESDPIVKQYFSQFTHLEIQLEEIQSR